MEPSPESGLGSTPRGVCATLRSEEREELDLGKLALRVVTPEELRQGRINADTHTHSGPWPWMEALLFRNVSRGVR